MRKRDINIFNVEWLRALAISLHIGAISIIYLGARQRKNKHNTKYVVKHRGAEDKIEIMEAKHLSCLSF